MILPPSGKKALRALLAFLCLSLASPVLAETGVRVGFIHDAHTGSPSSAENDGGLLTNILKYVAEQEKWHLQFVPGTLPEGFDRLNAGQINLLVAAPYSPERARQFDFTQESVISTWAQIYSPAARPAIQSFLDLKRLEVGLVRDDPYNKELRGIVKALNIHCQFIEFNNYEELLKAIQNEWVDAGVIDHLYSLLHGKKYAVVSSPVIFSPVELRFAVAKNRHPLLVDTLNYHIGLLKKNPNSIYYQLVDQMSGTSRDPRIYAILTWGLGITITSLLLFSLMILLLRYQVKKKTRQLTNKNQELENENTMRQKAEEALRESEELYRTLAERSFANVYVVQDGRFRFVNSNMIGMIGLPAEEIIGQRSLHFVHDEDRAEVRINAQRMLQGRRKSPYEYRMMVSDGSPRWMLETTTFIYYDGHPAVLGTAIDISEQKKAEEQRQILESKLRQSQKMEAIGTLAGGIAHDFNNILTAILGYSELTYGLLSGNKRERRYIGEVITGCERAKDLINQILTFSRRTDHTLQPVSITPVIKETVRLLRASLPSTIQIRTNTKVAHDTVLGDPTQIHQVLMNLGTNAAYAMHEGGGELTIELVAHPAAGGNSAMDASSGGTCHLELIVRDTGQGISADIMDRIFDPFFTTKEVGKGTGMGLSVVHGIVEAHGGKIAVESSSGKGTTFRVFIPLISSSSEHATKHEQPKTLPPGHECILWVDDEKALADLGQDMLTHLGYEVVSTTNSPEAVRLFSREPERFDLVITDMTMPYMTGIELAGRLRAIRSDIPIVLCTGFSATKMAEAIKTSAINELIAKPFNFDKLAATVRRVLSQNREPVIDIRQVVETPHVSLATCSEKAAYQ